MVSKPHFILAGGKEKVTFETDSYIGDSSPYGSVSFSAGFGYVRVYCQSPDSDTSGVGSITRTTSEKIDLTYYDTLKIHWKGTKGGGRLGDAGFSRFGIANTKAAATSYSQDLFVRSISRSVSSGWGELIEEIDVSDLTGEYYISIAAYQTENDSGYTSITIDAVSIWLE